MSIPDVADGSVIKLPQVVSTHDITRAGMGYRGVWKEQGILMELTHVASVRGDLSGMLRITVDSRGVFRGRFNVASLTTRTSLARDLAEITGYSAWRPILERFCWAVIDLDDEGPVVMTVGQNPRRTSNPCLIDPILPLGAPTIFFGEGGSFKSTLAAMLAVSVQTGLPLFADWQPRKGNVMILDWESGPDEWNDRVVGICNGLGIDPPTIQYRQCSQRLRDIVEPLSVQIQERSIALLIVDSVTPAQGATSDGASIEDATNRMFDALRVLGTTSLLVDHVNKDGAQQAKGRRSPYGSIVKVNRARAIFDIRREESPEYSEASQIAMIDTKANDRPKLPTYGLRVVHGQTAILLEQCQLTAPDLEVHSGSTAHRMRTVLADGAMHEEDLADRLDVAPATIRSTLRRHQRDFTRLPNGRIGLSLG